MDETLAKALEILRLAALNARGEVGYSHVGSPNQSSEGWPAIKFCPERGWLRCDRDASTPAGTDQAGKQWPLPPRSRVFVITPVV
jgi:hypothetical protein